MGPQLNGDDQLTPEQLFLYVRRCYGSFCVSAVQSILNLQAPISIGSCLLARVHENLADVQSGLYES